MISTVANVFFAFVMMCGPHPETKVPGQGFCVIGPIGPAKTQKECEASSARVYERLTSDEKYKPRYDQGGRAFHGCLSLDPEVEIAPDDIVKGIRK